MSVKTDKYEQCPKLCLFCEAPILYDKRRNDYCNHSCAANHLNLIKGRGPAAKLDNCLFCSKVLSEKGQSKYCSRDCMLDFWWQENVKELVTNGCDKSYDHRMAKRYLVELHDGRYQICKLTEWLDKPIALVLDHINGNSEDGSLSNLRVICNNCDAQTDFYKSKNIGNGRAKRRQRYKEGKSY